MQIGFLVNTANALVQIPLYTFGRLLRAAGLNFPAGRIQNMVCSKKAMEGLNKIDEKTKRYFSGLYGWNLFVVTSSAGRSLPEDRS
jgi:hypothetical protein